MTKIVNFIMSTAVEVSEVVKIFGNIRALDGLSFEVKSGEVFGLIGPNGAGKTTALRIISTLLLPTYGTVKVFRLDVVENATTDPQNHFLPSGGSRCLQIPIGLGILGIYG